MEKNRKNIYQDTVEISGRMKDWRFPVGRTHPAFDLSEEEDKHFKRLLNKTKGKANNKICFEMMLGGVDDKTIEKVADAFAKNHYFDVKNEPITTETPSGEKIQHPETYQKNEATKIYRKAPIYKRYGEDEVPKLVSEDAPLTESFIGRAIDKIMGEGYCQKMYKKYGYKLNGSCDYLCALRGFACVRKAKDVVMYCEKTYSGKYVMYSSTIMDVNYSSSAKNCLKSLCFFGTYTKERRDEILSNDLAKEIFVRKKYENYVPQKLSENFTEAKWVKYQTETFFDELYAMTQVENVFENDYTKTLAKEANPDMLRTLSTIGYHARKINNPETLALVEVSGMYLEAMGIGIYHYGQSSEPAKSYKRILQKIVSMYKTYGKLVKQNLPADSIRQTILEQFSFWLSDYGNTDGMWVLFTRKDWQKPVLATETKTPKSKGQSSGNRKSKIATPEEALALFNSTNLEEAEE